MDLYGKALKDYANGEENKLILHNNYGAPEEMPLWYLFREYEDMPELEKMALSVCEGDVLDVGAGTGAHSLILQQFGHKVTAIDTSPAAIDIMHKSGVNQALEMDFFALDGEEFDTILLLMNGIGMIGLLEQLKSFLVHVKTLLKPEGQLIFDSSDIRYLYEEKDLPVDKYFGEVTFQYEYKGIKGASFEWVYIDQKTLSRIADEAGWYVYFLHQDENDQYLVRMIPK